MYDLFISTLSHNIINYNNYNIINYDNYVHMIMYIESIIIITDQRKQLQQTK